MGTIYGVSGMRYGRKGCEWLQKEGGILTSISDINPFPAATIDAIFTFFDESVESGTIIGEGAGNSANNRLIALRNMLELAADLIFIGDIEGACGQLTTVINKTDGNSKPGDFVTGVAVSNLHTMIIDLMVGLGCE